MPSPYSQPEPARSDIDAMGGPLLLEFGTNWCGFCRAAQPLVEQALAAHPGVRHIKVEDGSGRKLGRSFQVTLWPTLIFLDAGREVARLVRPARTDAIEQALSQISAPP